MKCIGCGRKTENTIVCPDCRSVDACLPLLTFHVCRSFYQVEGDTSGSCAHFLECEPIKKALKKEPLIEPILGHVVCPHASINLGKIIYGKFTEKELMVNYSECIE